MRFSCKVYFQTKSEKKSRFSGFEPRTTDITDARYATKLVCFVVFLTAPSPTPLLLLVLVLLKRDLVLSPYR